MRKTIYSLLLIAGVHYSVLGQGLSLENANSKYVYFAYNGSPLLSFGGLSDFIFYGKQDAYDYKLWADWAADHGMNHVRAYPSLSWKHSEKFLRENGGDIRNAIFPYKETSPGSRQFDLMQFDEEYWAHIRQQFEYLQAKGIIVHLLMWNGWQLRDGYDWEGHFFNPDNNINSFTDHLVGSEDSKLQLYHSVADKQHALVTAQKAWFNKLIETTADLDNVYYDLVHEIAEHHEDWPKVRIWIEEVANEVRQTFQAKSKRTFILGMDTGGLNKEQRDWIFSREYFNILIYGKVHQVSKAISWREQYLKPYIPQESWDDDNTKYSLMHPVQRTHLRKYLWKFMLAKCQQMDIYMKERDKVEELNLPEYPHNYDPRGRNMFEDDAKLLRKFWNTIKEYPQLYFNGKFESDYFPHQYILSSPEEAIIYLSSATGAEEVRYQRESITLYELPLEGDFKMVFFNPSSGAISSEKIEILKGQMTFKVPEFTDDIAIHIYQ